MTALPDHLAERYGALDGRRRVVAIVVSVLLAAAFLGWLGWAGLSHATPTVTSQLSGFSVEDAHTVKVTLSVSLDGDAEAVDARCLLRALAEDHTPVGDLSFVPSDGRNEVVLRTERRATAVDLIGCTADGQARAR